MHIIDEITEFSKAKIRLLFSDSTFLVLYKGMIDKDTKELSDEEFDRMYRDMLSYGKKRAMNLLVKKDYSRKELVKKLSDDGYSPEITDEIFSFLDGFHYLDDERLAENLVRYNRGKKSRLELKMLLKKRELEDDVIDNAIEEYYRSDDSEFSDKGDDTDQEITVLKNHLRKLGVTQEQIAEMEFKDKQKLAAKLMRKGFKAENIYKAMKLSEF